MQREVYSLYARVEPGNSGGPLVGVDGSVAGIVFAKSLDDPTTGYALTIREIASDIRAGIAADGKRLVGRMHERLTHWSS